MNNNEDVTYMSRPHYCSLTLIQVILQFATAAGMTQFAQSLGLNLTNSLTSNMELFANFFQSSAATIIQSEAQLENFTLALSQAFKHILYLLFQKLVAGSICWSKSSMILNEITQVTIFFLANWRLKTYRLLA